jgi:CRP/FNR family nitrogen fixation transcriptional regulator
VLELPMSRQDIADYLGLTIETVSRTFTGLQAEGVIDVRGCRRVRLLDRPALTELCE